MTIKQDIQNFYYTKDWYTNALNVLKELYPDNYKLFAACIAATSPRQNVKSNWKLAKKAYEKMIDVYQSGKISCKFPDYMKAHKNNLEKIFEYFQGNRINQLELSGQKVNAFYQNIIGNLNIVTVDIWMLRYYGYDVQKPNKKQYHEISKLISRTAKQYNLFPAEVQAILWSAIRHKNGQKPATFLIASVDDYQLQFNFMKG